jgi:flagellar biosynthetic protein FlhB
MAGEDDEAEKEFEPSQRKLDEARKQGDIPRSADLTTAAAQGGFLLALMLLGAGGAMKLGGALERLLGDAALLSDRVFDDGEQAFAGATLTSVMLPVLPWFALPAALALLSIGVQRGFAISGDKVMPKLSRIDPIANARQKFGLHGLVEFLKSVVKLSVVAACLFLFLSGRLPEILATSDMSERAGLVVLMHVLTGFLTLAVLIAVAIGGADFLWQHFSHRQKLRMTRKEVQEENKQNEGDPHLKQQRRQKGYDIATNRMLQDVPTADVVVVNPTHYAVALKWERLPGKAPICVAKGVDEVAARIREIAMTAGVPIHRDPPTARALYAGMKIGQEIHPDHYRTVAAAIRFAESIRQKARRR